MKKMVILTLNITLFTYLILFTTLLVPGQANAKVTEGQDACLKEVLALPGIKKVELSHAQGFEIYSVKLKTILRVKKPWTGAEDQFIFLGKDLNLLRIPQCKKSGLYYTLLM